MNWFSRPPITRSVFLAVAALSFSGCGLFSAFSGPRSAEKSSSVVAFLYPNQEKPRLKPVIPVLHLPLRVGLAFVPSLGGREGAFSEAQKTDLLARVSAEFKALPFIESIQIIPATYLRPGGGFANVDQVRSLLDIDVIVLLSYDQVQFTDVNRLSLAYWTVVGAYFFNGNQNDTHTLMEAVVCDIATRKLLFRAPGVSHVDATSTAVGLRDQLRADGVKGFDLATGDLIRNLKAELNAFRERIKSAPGEVQVEHRPGYSGGGAIEAWFAGALAFLWITRWATHRKR